MDIVIWEKKSKALRVFMSGIFMAAASVGVFYIGLTGGGILYLVIGVFAIIFFGACLFHLAYRLIRPTPLLMIQKDGICDTSSANAVGYIGFDEIKEFKLVSSVGDMHISIRVTDLEEFLKNKSKLIAQSARANVKAGRSPFAIRLSTADGYTIAQVEQLLSKALGEYRAANSQIPREKQS